MYALQLTDQAVEDLDTLSPPDRRKAEEALDRLERDPSDPLIGSHRYETATGPAGQELWHSYLDITDLDGLRMWWWHGPQRREITVLAIGPHRD